MSKKLVSINKPVDLELIQFLDDLREKVLKGSVKGITVFLSLAGDEVSDGSAGKMNLSELMLSFENFKFKQLFLQNVTEAGKK
jgi:hypothetical protein